MRKLDDPNYPPDRCAHGIWLEDHCPDCGRGTERTQTDSLPKAAQRLVDATRKVWENWYHPLKECALEQAAVNIAGKRFPGEPPDLDTAIAIAGKRFPGEPPDLDTAIAIADKWGYGNVIQALRNSWSKMLQAKWKFDKEAADRGAGHICVWCNIDSRTGRTYVAPKETQK
jgi:hypothetical protein